ncbi:MAG: phosphoribosylformylglycinamidine synthase subunit PurL, partial [Ignavibacteriales bacterium]|nr:phosphoribosylformylglycinamidine synthase subunit PurL [Ignavibacteriales bacterium]
AGLVDIGDGLAIAFKIESHNHPSAVEPYQGAATGVGGILRDIFTMGARPIAALNSLRFGELSNDRVKYLFKRVVKGIGDYGNSFGVPTVAGEIYFDKCYTGNPLVNAMAVGLVEHGRVAKAIAKGPGNLVMIVGSSTGRDGIHGATFASEEISEASEAKRPSVQVGDPFTEKLLLEATLEAIRAGYVVGIQDMGAAGLTCSSTEMSAKGNEGMIIHLDKVPLREDGMSSYEIMLSESQERMLVVVEKKHESDIKKIFDKWDLHAVTIGEVVSSPKVTIFLNGELKGEVPAETLVLGGGAPVYLRDAKEPEYLTGTRSFNPDSVPIPSDYSKLLLNLMGSPNIASKRWAYEQYDPIIRCNTIVRPGSDAAVIRIEGTTKAIALKTDCNSRYVYLNPRRGGQIAVAESARNVVCTGAKPLAITNCLNFGNPYDPEIYWQFKEAVAGIGDACNVLETPVTGGNVSFYNEDPQSAVFPTPVIGMLGLIEDLNNVTHSNFKAVGHEIILLGENRGEVGGSEYLFQATGKITGDAPSLDLNYERQLQTFCLHLIGQGLVQSAHDCSEGGLVVALAESCFQNELGAVIHGLEMNYRPDFVLFGEDQSRIIISAKPTDSKKILELSRSAGVGARVIGQVTKEPLFDVMNKIKVDISQAKKLYETAISKAVGE